VAKTKGVQWLTRGISHSEYDHLFSGKTLD